MRFVAVITWASLGVATELTELEDASAVAPPAADGLDYLLAIVV